MLLISLNLYKNPLVTIHSLITFNQEQFNGKNYEVKVDYCKNKCHYMDCFRFITP